MRPWRSESHAGASKAPPATQNASQKSSDGGGGTKIRKLGTTFKFCQLILRKMIKTAATRCHILSLKSKMRQIRFRLGKGKGGRRGRKGEKESGWGSEGEGKGRGEGGEKRRAKKKGGEGCAMAVWGNGRPCMIARCTSTLLASPPSSSAAAVRAGPLQLRRIFVRQMSLLSKKLRFR